MSNRAPHNVCSVSLVQVYFISLFYMIGWCKSIGFEWNISLRFFSTKLQFVRIFGFSFEFGRILIDTNQKLINKRETLKQFSFFTFSLSKDDKKTIKTLNMLSCSMCNFVWMRSTNCLAFSREFIQLQYFCYASPARTYEEW